MRLCHAFIVFFAFSADFISGEEDGSTPEPPVVDPPSTTSEDVLFLVFCLFGNIDPPMGLFSV